MSTTFSDVLTKVRGVDGVVMLAEGKLPSGEPTLTLAVESFTCDHLAVSLTWRQVAILASSVIAAYETMDK